MPSLNILQSCCFWYKRYIKRNHWNATQCQILPFRTIPNRWYNKIQEPVITIKYALRIYSKSSDCLTAANLWKGRSTAVFYAWFHHRAAIYYLPSDSFTPSWINTYKERLYEKISRRKYLSCLLGRHKLKDNNNNNKNIKLISWHRFLLESAFIAFLYFPYYYLLLLFGFFSIIYFRFWFVSYLIFRFHFSSNNFTLYLLLFSPLSMLSLPFFLF